MTNPLSLLFLCVYVLFCCSVAEQIPDPVKAQGVKKPWSVGQIVETTSGYAKGHVAKVPGARDVSEYLGIRYGASTAGRSRFLKSRRYLSEDSFDADKFGPGCPALPLGPGPPLNNTQSEDCLFVNVWTKPEVGEEKKAVLVWIFGGGFSGGDSADPLYNGAKLAANQDVVVVSMNYRTNIFGFPGNPDLPDKNLGLLDQRLAVEWISHNIENFGGDPDRITLFGESAGASSVDYYSYIWYEDTQLVNAFISESGTAMITGPFAPAEQKERSPAWFNMTTTLGCGGVKNSSASFACAQDATYQEIQSAMPKAAGFKGVVGFFGPTYDDETVFKDYYTRAQEGDFIQKPLLIGSNQNESTIFTMIPPRASAEIDLALNNGFRCGAAAAAKSRFDNGVPVWRYHYSATKNGSTTGAFHGAEIRAVFNGDEGLSQIMQTAWGNFAKNPRSGLSKYGWPRYDPSGKTLIRLGNNGAVQPEFIDATTYDGQCAPSPL